MDLEKHQKTFIWKKKYEEQGQELDEREIELKNQREIEENRTELERIKERQRKRELEYEQKVKDSEFLQRQKEAQQYKHWEQQEDNFVLRQHRLRSKIRIRDGRAKPIDLFAHYISLFGEQVDDDKGKIFIQEEQIDLSDTYIELVDPVERFNGLRISDLESLEHDIKLYMNADSGSNLDYWHDLLTITVDELAKLRASRESNKKLATSSHQESIHPAVAADVISLFESLSPSELDRTAKRLANMLSNRGNPSIDYNFFGSALSRLKAYRAKIRTSERHKENLRKRAEQMSREKDFKQDITNSQSRSPSPLPTGGENMKSDKPSTSSARELGEEPVEPLDTELDEVKNSDDDETVQNLERGHCIKAYRDGRYSPDLIPLDKIDPSILVIDIDEDIDILDSHRRQILSATNLNDMKLATLSNDERAFLDAARKGMSNEEAQFSCEEKIRGHDNRALSYSWADKYRPRKPRYFNRVHTGFEWNKYNQTHYDIDNPPPKVVQGYKFNIFYPDLIDKSKTPTYSLTPCRDDKDFTIIRFSAGPPYEDIAFRIVNREWNNSHKSGYRCQFINNILQLWFHFKRYRYRR